MTSQKKRLLISALVGTLAWWGVVFGEIYFKCRVPESEGCSWAHAFFPELTVPLFFVIIGFPSFLLCYAVTGWLASRKPSGDFRKDA
jgi:hypothetical protein